MDNATLIAVAAGAVALVAGLALGYLAGRSSRASVAPTADLAPLQQALAARDAQLAGAVAERDAARADASSLQQRLGNAERLVAAADARLEAERSAHAQRLIDIQADQQRLTEQFDALSKKALEANREQFLSIAQERLKATQTEQVAELAKREKAVEVMVEPLKETLTKVQNELQALETKRVEAYAGLREQVAEIQRNNESLRTETAALVKTLRAPQARGRWGELQLRRLVEVAGMTARCDFIEQASAHGDDGLLRPDMVVKLADDKNIVVDSKVTLAAFIEAHESLDDTYAEERLQAHAKHLRKHVNDLAAKAYWNQFSPAPEFVVLFVPGESFLAPALERDPSLMEDAMAKKVMIATPTTLMAMLRTVAYAWQQNALTENAREVFELGRELYERLGTLGAHVDKLGKSVERVVNDYNTAVSSLEKRVLVSARRLSTLKVVDGDLDAPRSIEVGPTPLRAAELRASVDAADTPVQLLPPVPTDEAEAEQIIDLVDELTVAEPLTWDGTTGR
jgi:DNA recombination protein RmuC